MQNKLLCIFLICVGNLFYSNGDSTHVIKAKKSRFYWDTTKYEKYDRVIIVGVFQSYRNFSNEMSQLITPDSASISSHNYQAESNLISGLSFCFDKFSFSLSTRSKPPEGASVKGNTKHWNFGFNIANNRYVIENYYRRFVGFYDKNHPNYTDTTKKVIDNYNVQPRLLSALFSTRFMFFNKHSRFSYKSGFGSNYRQKRSAGSWIFGGSFNVYNLKNDSSFFSPLSRPYYKEYGALQGFRSVGIGAHVGAAATIVLFKAWFVTGYFTLGPEQQWRTYNFNTFNKNQATLSWSGTGRIAAGLNLRRFYALVSFSNDYALYDNASIRFRTNSITGNFNLGWRFNVKIAKFYQKFMESKLYKYL